MICVPGYPRFFRALIASCKDSMFLLHVEGKGKRMFPIALFFSQGACSNIFLNEFLSHSKNNLLTNYQPLFTTFGENMHTFTKLSSF